MPLRVGDEAPPFRAPDADGRAWARDDLRGAPFVLFFYPADETPGCVAEACAFRDAEAEFAALGVRVVGVSRDPPGSHARFAQRRRLGFLLLSDEDASMHRAYKALALGFLPRRVTYLVDAAGRVAAVHEGNLRAADHAARMLEAAHGAVARQLQPEDG